MPDGISHNRPRSKQPDQRQREVERERGNLPPPPSPPAQCTHALNHNDTVPYTVEADRGKTHRTLSEMLGCTTYFASPLQRYSVYSPHMHFINAYGIRPCESSCTNDSPTKIQPQKADTIHHWHHIMRFILFAVNYLILLSQWA